MYDLDTINRKNDVAYWEEHDRLLDSLHNAEDRLGIERTDYTGWTIAQARARLAQLDALLADRTRRSIVADAERNPQVPFTLGEYLARVAKRFTNIF